MCTKDSPRGSRCVVKGTGTATGKAGLAPTHPTPWGNHFPPPRAADALASQLLKTSRDNDEGTRGIERSSLRDTLASINLWEPHNFFTRWVFCSRLYLPAEEAGSGAKWIAQMGIGKRCFSLSKYNVLSTLPGLLKCGLLKLREQGSGCSCTF